MKSPCSLAGHGKPSEFGEGLEEGETGFERKNIMKGSRRVRRRLGMAV